MLRAAGSALFWIFITLSSLAMFPVALLCWALTLPFDRRKVILHQLTCFWASLYTWLNPAWPVEVTGREKIDSREAYVMVANHQSLLDILVLFRLFRHFKWVSKIENFRIPCIGWNMYLNQYIQLKRGDRSSTSAMLRSCRENLANGNSIMMFPEGTRSLTGKLRSFKTGAFSLAKDARRPLLPIVVHGTASALPKRGVILQGHHRILIEVLDPLPYSDFANEDVEALAQRVRELIGEHLEKAPVRAS
ncbi:MAG: 1-acyl-sn-glycerol-3-phosphate acyltransferase [Deltaproteobacteria bacterium]|jgi:1-acyl-sn-glycerol-3-phosphate acyltransferase|nr:1-acyl-sn-glycerol-3-phosphate acyltransferase [Deltaproteobacteria bacterium]